MKEFHKPQAIIGTEAGRKYGDKTGKKAEKEHFLMNHTNKNTDKELEKAQRETKKNKGGKQLILPSFIFGIGNLGNTCFMSVILQCFNSDETITDQYLSNIEKYALQSDSNELGF